MYRFTAHCSECERTTRQAPKASWTDTATTLNYACAECGTKADKATVKADWYTMPAEHALRA